MKQYILSIAAWRTEGFAHTPGFIDAESKEEAEAFALETARRRIYPPAEGWYHHTVAVGEIALMKREDVSLGIEESA